MSEVVIRVEGLGKKYIIGHKRNGSDGLRHALNDFVTAPSRWFRRPTSELRPPTSDFWALRDVSFEVAQGEVVGIIGRNGAGKSTLLKILSRITEPTEGRVRIRGRVASLLEVGTGFHPELTGRENVFLNGAILGMSREEIKRKFDEIVAFAEVEKFLDTPVKRYSSGMYVRLAFAVAAHLEPEILIVDEVLAVGDAQFQKKCLGKMGEVSKEGRTVLFVSHNLAAVRSLCQQSILLNNGRVMTQGRTELVLNEYLSEDNAQSPSWKRAQVGQPASDVYFDEITISNSDDIVIGNLDLREPIRINICLTVQRDIDDSQVAVRLLNQEGVPIFTTANSDVSGGYVPLRTGHYRYTVEVPGGFLCPGGYSLIVASMMPGVKFYDVVQDKLKFSIEDTGNYATSLRDGRLGLVNLQLEWQRFENGAPTQTSN